jgi:hypothetical protein
MLGVGVACTTVTGQRTLNRLERAEAAADADVDADAVVHKRDRTLTQRALDRLEESPGKKRKL